MAYSDMYKHLLHKLRRGTDQPVEDKRLERIDKHRLHKLQPVSTDLPVEDKQ